MNDENPQGTILFGWNVDVPKHDPEQLRAIREHLQASGAEWGAWSHGWEPGLSANSALIGVRIASAEPDSMAYGFDEGWGEDGDEDLVDGTEVAYSSITTARKQLRARQEDVLRELQARHVQVYDPNKPAIYLTVVGGTTRASLKDAKGRIHRSKAEGTPTKLVLPRGTHELIVL